MIIRSFLMALAVIASTISFCFSSSVQAQAFPNKPIRLIVPFTAGGGTDLLARQLAENLTKTEGWNIVVENRAGGNGIIALSAIARSAPDGYEIILALRENIAIAPLLNPKGLTFDPLKSFTTIAYVANAPMMIVAAKDSKYTDIKQVLETAKKDPTALRFGTSGQGSMSHLLLALISKEAKAGMVHVPYKGSNPALTDMIGGHVELVGGSIASAKPFIDSQRAIPLAVSSKTRVPSYPNVPTIAEQGYPELEVASWYGLFGPAGIPAPVVEKINAAVGRVLSNPAFLTTLQNQGMVTEVSTPAVFDTYFRSDYEVLAKLLPSLDMNSK